MVAGVADPCSSLRMRSSSAAMVSCSFLLAAPCSMRRSRVSRSTYMSRWRFCAVLTSLASTSICPRTRFNSPLSASAWFSSCTTPRLLGPGLGSACAGFGPVTACSSLTGCTCASITENPSCTSSWRPRNSRPLLAGSTCGCTSVCVAAWVPDESSSKATRGSHRCPRLKCANRTSGVDEDRITMAYPQTDQRSKKRAAIAARRCNRGQRTLLRFVRIDNIGAAIFGPAFLILTEGHRLLRPEADGLDLLVADTEQHHCALDAVRAALTQREVVLAAAAIVAVALHGDLELAVVHHEFGMRLDHRHVLFLDVVTVVFVIDAALCQRAAGFLELGPGIALDLRTADAGAGQRFADRLLALLALLLFVELPPRFFLLLSDLGLAVGILHLRGLLPLRLVLVEQIALFDIGALLALARAPGKQEKQGQGK